MEKKPLNEGLFKGGIKIPRRGVFAQDGALKLPSKVTQSAKPAGAPPKPAPLPKK